MQSNRQPILHHAHLKEVDLTQNQENMIQNLTALWFIMTNCVEGLARIEW